MFKYISLALFFLVTNNCQTNKPKDTYDGNKHHAKAEEKSLNKQEIDTQMLQLIDETKTELQAFKDRHANTKKDKNMDGILQLADATVTRDSHETLQFLTSSEYAEYRKDQEAARSKINVVDNDGSLNLTEGEKNDGVFVTKEADKPQASKKTEENDAGATWLIVTGVLSVPTLIGIGNLVVGAMIKDQGENASPELIQAGQVLNIITGATTVVAGTAVVLAGKKMFNAGQSQLHSTGRLHPQQELGARVVRGAGVGGAFIGAGVLAIGIAQIVAGSQMGLVENESEDEKTFRKLGQISKKVHHLLDLRNAAA